ncbi:MAG: DUF2254 domain-containing protein [Rhodospirillales bacterium]
MPSRIKGFLRDIRTALWLRPSLFCLIAIAAALVAGLAGIVVPKSVSELLPAVNTEAVTRFLELLAGSMLTAATVVLSALMLVLNLVAGQASPRAVPELMADRVTQNALGIFLATFVFSVTALLLFAFDSVLGSASMLLFVIAIAMVAMSIGSLLQWIHHVADALKLNRVIERLAFQASYVLDRYIVEDGEGDDDIEETSSPLREAEAMRVTPGFTGYVQFIDLERIGRTAEDNDLRVNILVHEGDFLHPDRAFALVAGPEGAELDEAARTIARSVVLGAERSSEGDPQLGIELLAEVACRSLSPGINDPKSALTCIEYLSALMVRAAKCPASRYPSGILFEGRVRQVRQSFPDLLERAWRPVMRDGGRHAEVICAVMQALSELAEKADRSHLDAVAGEVDRAEAFGEQLLQLEVDRKTLSDIAATARKAIESRTGTD